MNSIVNDQFKITIMYNTAIIVALFIAILESLLVIVGNIFTIFVFWKHRNRLKRTSPLLINLAVADLSVGITEPIALGAFKISGHFEETNFDRFSNNFWFCVSTFFSHSSLWNVCML